MYFKPWHTPMSISNSWGLWLRRWYLHVCLLSTPLFGAFMLYLFEYITSSGPVNLLQLCIAYLIQDFHSVGWVNFCECRGSYYWRVAHSHDALTPGTVYFPSQPFSAGSWGQVILPKLPFFSSLFSTVILMCVFMSWLGWRLAENDGFYFCE